MKKTAEESVSDFYNHVGWEMDGSVTVDASSSEDLRVCAAEYVSKCRMRVMEHIPSAGDKILDMASGPIQYPEYLVFSKNFRKRYCVDLSAKALGDAKKRLGDRGEYLHGSFFDIAFEKNFFDCSLSLHTIYHMDKSQQAVAVRKLIEVTKPGAPVIIVYSNPKAFIRHFFWPVYLWRWARSKVAADLKGHIPAQELYFYRHPLAWWDQFADVSEVKAVPWRSFHAKYMRYLFPNNKIGKWMLGVLFKLENKFPIFFAKHFDYVMIVLSKKSNN